MANGLEKFFLSKLKQMPPVEFEMSADQLKRPNSNKKTPSSVRGKRVLPPGTGNTSSAAENSLNNDKKPDLGRFESSNGVRVLCKKWVDTNFVGGFFFLQISFIFEKKNSRYENIIFGNLLFKNSKVVVELCVY